MTLDPKTFFADEALHCARALIGAELTFRGCSGRIVETEAYLGEDDPACHTFYRTKARAFVAAHSCGTAYVYLNYGVHYLLNFLTGPAGVHGFVLIRALRPTTGLEIMRRRRKKDKDRDLCSGPGKLTAAFGIDGRYHGTNLLGLPDCQLVLPDRPASVFCDGRIGISRATELPYRFTAAEEQEWVSRPARS